MRVLPDYKRNQLHRRVSALLPFLLLCLILFLHLTLPETLDRRFVYEPKYLLPVLNTVFITLASFVVAYIAGTSYLMSGILRLLFLGSGAMAFGLVSLIAGLAVGSDANLAVTIFNCGALLGGALHLTGAVVASVRSTVQSRPMRRMRDVAAAYLGTLFLLLLITHFILERVFPLFFVPGLGATPLRQAVLGSAAGLYGISSVIFLQFYYKRKQPFFYWYALGLMLTAIGLIGVLLLRSLGGPIGWSGRLAQFLGGIYFVSAVLDALKDARTNNISLGAIFSNLFRQPVELYRALVQTVDDAIIVLGREGRVQLWNPAAEKVFGFAPDEALGRSIYDLIVAEENAADFARILQPFSYHLDGEVSRRIEAVAKAKNGRLLPVEVSVTGTWISDQAITTVVIRDITERKHMENDLRSREHEYRALVENNPDMVIRLDKDLRRTYANSALEKTTGFRPSQFLGKTIYDSYKRRPELLKRLETACLKVLATGKEEQVDYPSVTARGPSHFHMRLVPEFGVNGEVQSILTITRDVTAMKQAEAALKLREEELSRLNETLELRVHERTAELERRNAELQDFTFAASHDLQEPLRKIQTLGDMLVMKAEGCVTEELRGYIGRMQAAAARMQRLLRSLLEYSRIVSRSEPLVRVDLAEIVRGVLSSLEVQIKEANSVVEIGDLPEVEADGEQMTRLFQNLIGNALKYRREGEPVRVRVYSGAGENGKNGGNSLAIYVEDNGIGFEERYLDRIFLPFQRLHGRNEYSGEGMGLAICKKIVEGHGGTITARAEPGKGAAFVIRLPGTVKRDETVPHERVSGGTS